MEKVIAGLKAAGHRVAAVKHDAHRFEIDHPGKDSFRFTAAGVDITVISSRSILARFVEGVDIILAEGYKASRFPKIEVHRKATGEPLIDPPPPGLIAVATDERVDTAVPQLDIHDSERLVELIQEKYLRRP
jgi:molybdopterin-guanine dinucleotide biosynthesis protein MobB